MQGEIPLIFHEYIERTFRVAEVSKAKRSGGSTGCSLFLLRGGEISLSIVLGAISRPRVRLWNRHELEHLSPDKMYVLPDQEFYIASIWFWLSLWPVKFIADVGRISRSQIDVQGLCVFWSRQPCVAISRIEQTASNLRSVDPTAWTEYFSKIRHVIRVREDELKISISESLPTWRSHFPLSLHLVKIWCLLALEQRYVQSLHFHNFQCSRSINTLVRWLLSE